MHLTRLKFNQLASIVSFINLLSANFLRKHQYKTHDYTELVCGADYVFELLDNPQQAQITAQGKGIKSGDRIILQNHVVTEIYKVEEVDYYSDPSDMWMGLLQKEDCNK